MVNTKICKILNIEYKKEMFEKIFNLPRNVNSGIGREGWDTKNFTKRDLIKADPKMFTKIIELANQYGYKL